VTATAQILPKQARGGGPLAQRVVEGQGPKRQGSWHRPSTMLRMVPLPIFDVEDLS
jgi:hypothetical protein